MEKLMFGTQDIKELKFNCCHIGLCNRFHRKHCDKVKKCETALYNADRYEIAKVSPYKNWEYGDKTSKKIEKAVDKWRKEQYKKCRPIRMVIERGKWK